LAHDRLQQLILRGNLVDLAVAVIVGVAFGAAPW
jgi:large-conductance mechanosensitive channel